MTDKIKMVWTSHLRGKEERERFKRQLLSNPDVFERLAEILEEYADACVMEKPDYDSPSWAYKQAHYNGYIEAISDIFEILPNKPLTKEEK